MLEKTLELGRQRRFERHTLAAYRVLDDGLAGVKEHALKAQPRNFLVQCKIAILVIAGNWKSEVREMHADLMRAPGLEFRFEEAEVAPPLAQADALPP